MAVRFRIQDSEDSGFRGFKIQKIHNSQFTIHNSQFTIHNSQFTIHNSQFTIHFPKTFLLTSCQMPMRPSGLNRIMAMKLRPNQSGQVGVRAPSTSRKMKK